MGATNWDNVINALVLRIKTNLGVNVNQDSIVAMPTHYPYVGLWSQSTDETVGNRQQKGKYLVQAPFNVIYIQQYSGDICLASKARELMQNVIDAIETSAFAGDGFNLRRTGRKFSIDKTNGIILVDLKYNIYFTEAMASDYKYFR